MKYNVLILLIFAYLKLWISSSQVFQIVWSQAAYFTGINWYDFIELDLLQVVLL